jgi:hypothetical protein
MSDSGIVSVGDAIKAIAAPKDVLEFVTRNRLLWVSFGVKTSHTYRTKLLGLMSSSELTDSAKFMVFFLASVIKNKARILEALNNSGDNVKMQDWYGPVKDFYTTKTVQYTSNQSTKMPVVNIPSCLPSFDMLAYCLMKDKSDRSLEELSRRPTFAQLHLDSDMQTLAKLGYEFYWTRVVRGTNNPNNKGENSEKPGMNEGYYETAAGDKYKLIGENFKEVEPRNSVTGYTRKEIEDYLARTAAV